MRFSSLIDDLVRYHGDKTKYCPYFGDDGTYKLYYDDNRFVLFDMIFEKEVGELYCPDFVFSVKNCQLVVEWAYSYVHSYSAFLSSMDLYENIVFLAIYGDEEIN